MIKIFERFEQICMISRRRRLKNSDRPNDRFNPNKRIENAYTQFGRIANSTERPNDPFNPKKAH